MRKIKLLKKVLTLFVLLLFIIIGFFHNSMMSFAMQNGIHSQIMGNMEVEECCISIDSDFEIFILNNNFKEKVLKIKLINLIDIFQISSKFLENKNLIKNNPPPNFQKKIKNYSYSDLIKVIKSNI